MTDRHADTSADTQIDLVTGANKGIGRAIAAALAELGHTVIIGARSADQGASAATELQEAGGDVTSVVLDVTDPASVTAAASWIAEHHGRLDALINNAAISRPPGGDLDTQLPRSADVEVVRSIFETNVFGLISVTVAMLPLLRRSKAARIVNMSSSAGSLAALADLDLDDPPSVGYVPSKTAVTALTLLYARDLRADGILVNAVNPGFVATDLNNYAGHRTPEQGAAAAVRMATIPADGPTGTFTDDTGKPVPW